MLKPTRPATSGRHVVGQQHGGRKCERNWAGLAVCIYTFDDTSNERRHGKFGGAHQ